MGQKIYIAKYALSAGIKEAEIDNRYNNDGGHIWPKGYYMNFELGKEVFYSKDEAIKQAEKMRLKKIERLKKQIKKLENLKFD